MEDVIITDFTVNGEEVEWAETIYENIYVHTLENEIDTLYYSVGSDKVVHKGPLINKGTMFEYRLIPIEDNDVDLRHYLHSTSVKKIKTPVYYHDSHLTPVELLFSEPDLIGKGSVDLTLGNYRILLSIGLRERNVLLYATNSEHIYRADIDMEVKGSLYLNLLTGETLFKQYDSDTALDTWYNLTPLQTASSYKDEHTEVVAAIPVGCLIESRVLSRRAPKYGNDLDEMFKLISVYPPE